MLPQMYLEVKVDFLNISLNNLIGQNGVLSSAENTKDFKFIKGKN
jgi:hypothetical protein